MQLDVFYKELSYTKIQQKKAFEFGSLLGEVGGFLGLLLGIKHIYILFTNEYCQLYLHIVLFNTLGLQDEISEDISVFIEKCF